MNASVQDSVLDSGFGNQGEMTMQRTLQRCRRLSGCLGLALVVCLTLFTPVAAQTTGSVPTAPIPAGQAPETTGGQSATLLPDGRWLLLGGQRAGHAQGDARLFDARAQETVVLGASMAMARGGHTATVLPDGTVLIVGGFGADGRLVDTVERFDPATQTVTSLTLPLSARALHTATLLTDGRLLIVGGVGPNGAVRSDVEVVNTFTGSVEQFDARLETARFGHLAALLPSAPMQVWGGLDSNNRPVESVEFFDPQTQRFAPLNAVTRGFLPDPLAALSTPVVTGVYPNAGTDIPIDAVLTARFSKSLDVTTLNTETVTLFGPRGPEPARIVAAEAGILLFVTPVAPLTPGASYTLFINGARDQAGVAMPLAALPFRTGTLLASSAPRAVELGMAGVATLPAASEPQGFASAPGAVSERGMAASTGANEPSAGAVGNSAAQSNATAIPSTGPFGDVDEFWVPGPAAFGGDWRSKRVTEHPKLKALAAVEDLVAAAGVTAVSGHALRLNGRPLVGATVRIGERVTYTDGNGRFLVSNVAAGWQRLSVDGSTANRPDAKYGRHDMRVHVTEGKTNPLVWTVWVPKLDTEHATRVDSPTRRYTVLSSPYIPGLEFQIPAGTVIRDRAGNIVTELTITPVPIDQTAHPLPDGGFPVYFTLQPSGLRFESATGGVIEGVRLRYPNYDPMLKVGSPANFWSYDPEQNGWEIYAQGVVTKDNFIEMPAGALYGFKHFDDGGHSGGPPPPNDGPPCNSCPCSGGGPPPGGDGGGGGDPPGGGDPDPGFPGFDEAGDPCSVTSGQFTLVSRDLRLRDVIPIDVTRVYRPNDARVLPFGIGTTWPYGMFLSGGVGLARHPLVMANGSRIYFDNVNGNLNHGGIFVNATTPGPFFGAVMEIIVNTAEQFTILRRDGTLYTFDVAGNLIAIRNRAGVTVRLTSSGGKISRITSPSGRWVDVTYAGALITQIKDLAGRTVTYGYTSNRLTTVTNPNGGVWTYAYDANGRMRTVTDPRNNVMVTNAYDANGRIASQTYADNTTMQFVYTLDTAGKVTQTNVTDRRGNVRRVQLDAAGNIQQDTFPVGAPEQQVFTFTRNPVSNLLTSATDALGRRTDYTYDGKGNRLTMTRLAGTPNAVTTTFTYEPVFNQVASIKDPLSHTSTFAYDAAGNLAQITDPLTHTNTMTYDPQGQMLTVTNGLNFTTTLTYDAGRIATATDPLNRTTTMFSDVLGRVVRTVDAVGNAATTQYDSLDRVTVATDALGNTVRYEYDANSNMTAHIDQKGNRTEYTYDAMNRRISRKDALLKTESYMYDVGSRLQRLTDRKLQVSGFTYDGLNRRTQAGFGATPGNPTAYGGTIGYAFDAGNRLIQATDSQNGIITRSYDDLDRMTGETTMLAATAYTYDAAGRRMTRTVPGQSTMTYSWDDANRLAALTQGGQTVAFAYDSANRRTSVTLPNGIAVSYAYDAANQLTAITYKRGATTLGDLTYTYDGGGRRVGIGGSFARSDLPLAIDTTGHNVNNQLTQWAASALSYDLNGNLISDGSTSYIWNARNQLVEVRLNGITVATYQYDAFGRRQQKYVAGTTTQFVYDGKNFVQERDANSAVTANLLTGLGLDEVYARTKGTNTSSYLTNHLGTIVAEADAAGAIQTSYSYEPYGKTVQTGAASDNSQRYTGREQDTAELYYFRARYYSPKFNRFASEDPIGVAGGMNIYQYVRGDPIDLMDLTGLASTPCDWKFPLPGPLDCLRALYQCAKDIPRRQEECREKCRKDIEEGRQCSPQKCAVDQCWDSFESCLDFGSWG